MIEIKSVMILYTSDSLCARRKLGLYCSPYRTTGILLTSRETPIRNFITIIGKQAFCTELCSCLWCGHSNHEHPAVFFCIFQWLSNQRSSARQRHWSFFRCNPITGLVASVNLFFWYHSNVLVERKKKAYASVYHCRISYVGGLGIIGVLWD